MKVKIINNTSNTIPHYETNASAGMDLKANLETPVILRPMERVIVNTGIVIELPIGYEAQVRPRSGLAIKHGITVLNAPGTIDADFRGEIGVILINLSDKTFKVQHGDRIAQLVIAKYESVVWDEVTAVSETTRGGKGFGSTGI